MFNLTSLGLAWLAARPSQVCSEGPDGVPRWKCRLLSQTQHWAFFSLHCGPPSLIRKCGKREATFHAGSLRQCTLKSLRMYVMDTMISLECYQGFWNPHADWSVFTPSVLLSLDAYRSTRRWLEASEQLSGRRSGSVHLAALHVCQPYTDTVRPMPLLETIFSMHVNARLGEAKPDY